MQIFSVFVLFLRQNKTKYLRRKEQKREEKIDNHRSKKRKTKTGLA